MNKHYSCSKLQLWLLLSGILLISSCQKDSSPLQQLPSNEIPADDLSEHVIFTDGEADNDSRVLLTDETIVLADTSLERSPCPKYAAWTKVAEVTTLEHSSQLLSTTHLALSDKVAIVSYHLRGATHYGAVETIDLSSPKNPKIKSQAFFPQADVNAVAIESNPSGNEQKVWVALSDQKDGAILGELVVKNKKFQNSYRRVKLTYELEEGISSSANNIAEAGNYLYVTSGRSHGGVFCLDKNTLEIVGFKEFPHAKGVAANGGTINESSVCALQSYGQPRIHNEFAGGSDFPGTFDINAITHQNVGDELGGKISMLFAGEGSAHLFFTAGKEGVKGYDISSGTLIFETPTKMLNYGNANGLSMDDEFMYVANGAEGLAVFPLYDGLPDASSTFIWDLDEPSASANFVASDEEWVFVAKGEGGFKILKKPVPSDFLTSCGYDNQGAPNCMSGNVTVCSSLEERIDIALPDDEELEELRPDYFTNGASEILLKADSRLKITFIREDTKEENSIGYYFYAENCPPASVSELAGMITFINFSAQSSGGGLEQGNTVKLPGKFKAGTRIGFFIIRDGWDGGDDIYYTNPAFNNDGKKHGLLFYDRECGDIIGAFHDYKLPNKDADFRDAIFKITPDVQAVLDTDSYLQL